MTQQSGRIWVMGGRPLNGTAAIPAAKNSVLPLLAAALLCRGPVRLRAVPRLSDVECSLGLLRGAGRGQTLWWPGCPQTAPFREKPQHKCGPPSSSVRRCWRGWAGLRLRCPAGAISAPGPSTYIWKVWPGWGQRSWTPGRESWCWPRRGDSTGQTSPSASPAWGRRRRCCWPLPAPEAPPSCGARRGSRRSLTLPTS